MTARQKYSQAIRNYNAALRRGDRRRANYWDKVADKQAVKLGKRIIELFGPKV